MSLNKVILIGNLGADPEFKLTAQQLPLCSFRLATNERASSVAQQHTEWHTIVASGKTAVKCSKYLKKGSQIYLEGKIRTSEYKDQDGHARRSINIILSSVTFIRSSGHHSSDGLTLEISEAHDLSEGSADAFQEI